jgi:hypothetical protein
MVENSGGLRATEYRERCQDAGHGLWRCLRRACWKPKPGVAKLFWLASQSAALHDRPRLRRQGPVDPRLQSAVWMRSAIDFSGLGKTQMNRNSRYLATTLLVISVWLVSF